MDRIDAMQAFARVVETGSFTKAAETLQTNKSKRPPTSPSLSF